MDKLARWPLLMAAITLTGTWVALDLSSQGPVAYGIGALAASSVGAFLYAEGARHREWWDRSRHDPPADDATPPSV